MLRINLSLLRYSSLKSSTCQWNTWKGLRSTRNSIRSIETSVSRVALRVDRREFASISSIASLSLANTAVYVGALCNAGLAASKGFIGISIGSTALVADAANSIGDLLSDVVVFFSLNAARQGTSENKPWGLGAIHTTRYTLSTHCMCISLCTTSDVLALPLYFILHNTLQRYILFHLTTLIPMTSSSHPCTYIHIPRQAN